MSVERETRIAVKLVLLFFAVCFLGVGIFLMNLHFKERRYLETTEAVIVDIVEDTYVEYGDDGIYSETDYYVYVDYTVDGVLYEYVPLNEYNFTMKIGDVVDVAYDTRNPAHLTSKNGTLIGAIVTMVAGSGFAVAFLLTSVGKRKNNNQ